jgi:hypothetical protein
MLENDAELLYVEGENGRRITTLRQIAAASVTVYIFFPRVLVLYL